MFNMVSILILLTYLTIYSVFEKSMNSKLSYLSKKSEVVENDSVNM